MSLPVSIRSMMVLIVKTHSAKIVELRKTLLDLYLARHPQTPLIQEMAADYGVTKTVSNRAGTE